MIEQRNNGEFHRADPVYRRQMQVFLALTIVLGILGLVALQWWLRKLGASATTGGVIVYQSWLNRLLAGLCLVLGVSAAGFAQWMYRMGLASKRERRWPPSSMRTSSDVRIRYLTSADSLVTQIQATAVALSVLALVLGLWAIWLFRTS